MLSPMVCRSRRSRYYYGQRLKTKLIFRKQEPKSIRNDTGNILMTVLYHVIYDEHPTVEITTIIRLQNAWFWFY